MSVQYSAIMQSPSNPYGRYGPLYMSVPKLLDSYLHLHFVSWVHRTTVTGTMMGCRSDGSELLIKQLETPIGTYPCAVLRQSDISSVKLMQT